MLQVKLFEVRDRATFMPCFGILLRPRGDSLEKEAYLLRRAGFGFEFPLVMFGSLEGARECRYDPYSWVVPPRTLKEAHLYVSEHWNELESGDVIDVEFVLGETQVAKVSERVR